MLGIVTLAALAGAVIEGGQRGFADGLVLTGFGLAVLAIAGFVGVESRRRSPMLPLGLFRSTTFAATSAIGLVVNITVYGLIFVLSLYFQTTRHYSPLATGLAFVPMTAVVLLANVTSGRLASRIGLRAVLAGSALLIAAGLGGLLVTDAATPYFAIVAQLVALGLGVGLLVPAMTSALLGTVDRDRSGVASGTLNTARQAGSVIGVALFGAFAATGLVSGLHLSLEVGIALAVIVLVLSAAVPGSARRTA